MELWHGSTQIVRHPTLDRCRPANDYGTGFYCTQHKELAKEWACPMQENGYANRYILDMEGLSILDLRSSEYSILNWMALLVHHRSFRAGTPLAREGIAYLEHAFLPDTSSYDVIEGYRADDSYFAFARAFVNNGISVKQLSRAMKLGDLGTQVMLKSRRAFDRLEFAGYEIADANVYYARRSTRDHNARTAYQNLSKTVDLDGLYIRDIIREQVGNDDPRIR